MTWIRRTFFLTLLPVQILCAGAPSASNAQTVNNCGAAGRTATFNFSGGFKHDFGRGDQYFSYPSTSAEVQTDFRSAFCDTVKEVERWFSDAGWPAVAPRFRVFVNNNFKISESLVPASLNRRGWMEFPARNVVTAEVPLVHELVHVYQPNGNRMLAEGFAVYLQEKFRRQNKAGPAFPNYERGLPESVRRLACWFSLSSLDAISLSRLDAIATPSPLELRIGQNWPESNDTYNIAGSFVEFLIEAWGAGSGETDATRMSKFLRLYQKTPLKPFERNGGSPTRWNDVYGKPLKELEPEWQASIGALNC